MKNYYAVALCVIASIAINGQFRNERSFKINNGKNDIEERTETGKISTSSSDLEISGIDGSKLQKVGLRFDRIDLPNDTEIVEAYIQFTSDDTSDEQELIKIKIEKGKSAPFQSSPYNLTQRSFFEETVLWDIPPIDKKDQRTRIERTPNIASLLQQAIQDNDYNNAFVFIIDGDKKESITMKSSDSGQKNAPELIIIYNSNMVSNSYYIEDEDNDAEEEIESGSVDLSSSDLELGGIDDDTSQIVGLRFKNVKIPANANVKEAYIQFTSKKESEEGAVKLYTEIGDGKKFTEEDYSISTRQKSSLSVNWKFKLFDEDHHTLNERTPNLREIINETRLRGWENEDDLVFIIEGNQQNALNMYSGGHDSHKVPELIIIYDEDQTTPWIEGIESELSKIEKLYINEVAANETKLINSDWIELYNAHDYPILIKEGIFLSNTKKQLEQFELKNIFIPAKSFEILYADNDPEKGNHHLNFKLKKSGGDLYLTKNNNTDKLNELSSIEYGYTSYNQTYGNKNNVSGIVETYLEGGTPYESNEESIRKLSLSASKVRGIYNSPFELILKTSQENKIIYTLDGSYPSNENGHIYSEPLLIDQTTVVKALAITNDGKSELLTHTYIISKNNEEFKYEELFNNRYYLEALNELPIVSISKDNDDLEGDEEPTTFEYFNGEEMDDGISIEAGIKKFGAFSYHYDKNNIRFYFRKKYAGKLNYDIFKEYKSAHKPTKKFSRLELKIGEDGVLNNDFDFGWLRFSDYLLHNAMLDMGHQDVKTQFVHVFINGKYYGIETLRETFDENFAESYIGGDEDDYVRLDNRDSKWRSGEVEKSQYEEQWEEIKDDPIRYDYQAIKERVDMPRYIDMMLLYLSTDIEYEARGLMNIYEQETIKFNLNDSDGLLWHDNGWKYESHWGSRLEGPGYIFGNMKDSENLEFYTHVKDAVYKHLRKEDGILTTDYFEQMIRKAESKLSNSYILDVARWGFREDLTDKWHEEINRIIRFLPTRFDDVINRFDEIRMNHTLNEVIISKNNQNDNIIILENNDPSSKIYFTLDGTDPMGNDGVIREEAIEYNSDLNRYKIDQSGSYTVFARSYKPNNWGPIAIESIDIYQEKKKDNYSLDFSSSKIEINNKVYPNPFNDEVHILFKEEVYNDPIVIQIINMKGRTVYSKSLHKIKKNESIRINTAHLISGYYFIKIATSKGYTTQKINKL